MLFLYNTGIQIYYNLIKIASLFNPKAKKWLQGRKGIVKLIENSITSSDQIIWFHCASLGEFEQGRPVIEAFKKSKPEYKVVLTFFSPSGYEIRKNYEFADYVFYLPIDTKENAERFIRLINPKLVVFVKYEFWYHYINELHKKGIPLFIISAIFRKQQHFFKSYGGWWRNMLKKTRHIYLQDEQSYNLLKESGIENISVSGDTRFDRVYQTALNKEPVSVIDEFCNNEQVFIAGSTWPEDEKILVNFIKNHSSEWKFIIAPHEVTSERIKQLEKSLQGVATTKFSDLKNNKTELSRVLIVDNIGYLSKLYGYGKISYIGGGFGKGIHNILEASAFGLPVIFGPNYEKFKEAKDLIDKKGAFTIKNLTDLQTVMKAPTLGGSSEICLKYVQENKGATKKIVKELLEELDN